VDRQYEDGRAHRRDVTGVESGAFGGAVLGLLVGLVVPGLGALVATVGGLAGAAIGRTLTKHVYLEEWDSSLVRSYVGLRAPDSDET
jgi:hypothetical protein